MIILDTNVLSELARSQPEERVVTWLDSLPISEVATTSITAAELLYGVARLPDGRRQEITKTVREMLDEDFGGRVESFDEVAATHYANIVAGREAKGRPISTSDAQIAAITRKLKATLATRNTKDFQETGLKIINPWKSDLNN